MHRPPPPLPDASRRFGAASLTAAIALALGCGSSTPAQNEPPPTAKVEPTPPTNAEDKPMTTTDAIARAVAAPARPAEDRERDADRKPAEVLAFFGVTEGMTVIDLMTGRGYYAELLANVVGNEGKVYAHNSKFVMDRFAREPITERLARPELSNAVVLESDLDVLDVPAESLDGALMVLFYHDTIWQGVDRPRMNKRIFAALKPGGFFGVIDHVAAGKDDVSKSLHRIDPEQLKAEITAAGFVLEAESDILRHPDDDHQLNVFDDAIRGKTDRVVLRFRRP